MCTLIALHRQLVGAPLVVAANRDEFYGRPAEGPALRATRSGPVVAPLDLDAGGSWLGLGAHGVFAAVTNVSRPESGPDPARRSRGALVLDALGARSAREAAEKLIGLPIGAYNPFNLLVADASDLFAVSYEDAPRPVVLADGIVVVGNAPLDAPPPPKLAGLRERARAIAEGPPDAALEALATICRDHSEGPRGPLDALCVHTPGYGTRSSALLRLGDGGLTDPTSAFRFAEGPPCESDYEDETPLLHDLGRGGPGGRVDQPMRSAP